MKYLTPEQETATRIEDSIFVGASAGTGKTHVLTARVLRMMVTGTRPDHILCLTYTKAAAAVMANRIFKTLGEWALSPERDLPQLVFAATGEEADLEDLKRARTLFARVLDLPGGLKIQTIHSFCQSLLGRFPIEAGLAPNFQVVDERTAAGLLREASEKVMDIAGENPGDALYEAFATVARQTNETDFNKVLNAFLAKRGEILSQINSFGGTEGLIRETRKALGLKPGDTREAVIQAAVDMDPKREGKLRSLADFLLAGGSREADFGTRLNTFLETANNPEGRFEALLSTLLTKDGTPTKTTYVFRKASIENSPEIILLFEAEQARLQKTLEKLGLLKVAENTESLLRLGTAILALYQAEKRKLGYLDYDDLIFKTRDLLGREGIAPWILYKLDGGLEHILVDEAQDTNQIQWGMVETLSREFFAGIGTREDVIRTVFAVGDPKQSIYRFQGAEPGQFLEARKRIKLHCEEAGLTFLFQDLATSFRSTRVVLDVVDAVFSGLPAAPGVKQEKAVIRHEAARIGMSGLIEVWPAETPDEINDAGEGWQLPFEQKFTPKPEAKLAAKIAGHIAGLIDNEEELKARGRKIRFGDIMVLVQRRGPFMDYLIRELKSLDVPVAGSDRMVLSEQLAVEDLLALGHFALLPEDDFNLAVVLKGPILDFNDNDLMDLAIGRRGSLWTALNEKSGANDKFKAGLEYLREILAMADFTTPFAFFSHILGAMSGRSRVYRRLGQEVGDPLDEFLALAQTFQKENTPSLQGFLKWFSAAETQIKRDMESGRNEVRVMTVHGAKGLEAPIVYLPDTFRTLRTRPDTLLTLESGVFVWSGKSENETGTVAEAREMLMREEREELNRLLYVALTRAEDRLYVSGWHGRNKPKEPGWYEAIFEAVSLLPGCEPLEGGDGGLRLESVQKRNPRSDEKGPLERRGTAPLPGWAKTPIETQETGFETLAPSRAEGGLCVTPGEFSEGKEKAIRRGNAIHKLLEVLPEIPAGKTDAAIASFLKNPAFKFNEEEQEKIRQAVLGILRNPVFKPLFAPGSRAEVAVAGMVGGKLVAGEVDRVALTDEDVLVVDYKSNRVVPSNIEEAPPSYIRQLQLYSTLLGEVYPGKKVRAALLWTETGTWMEIPTNLLHPAPLDEAKGST